MRESLKRQPSHAFARFGQALGMTLRSESEDAVNEFIPDEVPSLDRHDEQRYDAPVELTAMATSPDKSMALIAGKDLMQILKIDNIDGSVELLASLKPPSTRGDKLHHVTSAAWGSHLQQSTIAIAGKISGDVLVYRVEEFTGADRVMPIALSGHSRTVNSLDFSTVQPSLLASGSQDGSVKLWDMRIKANRAYAALLPCLEPIRDVKFARHDSSKIAAILDNGLIYIYDIRTLSSFSGRPTVPERKFTAHSGPGFSIDWHPEDDYLASGGRDRYIHVWNLASDLRSPEFSIPTPAAVTRVAWRPPSTRRGRDRHSLLSSEIAAVNLAMGDYRVHVWSLDRKFVPKYTLASHDAATTALEWRDDRSVWTASKDKSFRCNDIYQFQNVVDNLRLQALSWSPKDGSMCAALLGRSNKLPSHGVPAINIGALSHHGLSAFARSISTSSGKLSNSIEMTPSSSYLNFEALHRISPTQPSSFPSIRRRETDENGFGAGMAVGGRSPEPRSPFSIKRSFDKQITMPPGLQSMPGSEPGTPVPISNPEYSTFIPSQAIFYSDVLDGSEIASTFRLLAGQIRYDSRPKGLDPSTDDWITAMETVLDHNMKTADENGAFRTGQTWAILKMALGWELSNGNIDFIYSESGEETVIVPINDKQSSNSESDEEEYGGHANKSKDIDGEQNEETNGVVDGEGIPVPERYTTINGDMFNANEIRAASLSDRSKDNDDYQQEETRKVTGMRLRSEQTEEAVPPWNIRHLVDRALEYYVSQGDLQQAAAIALVLGDFLQLDRTRTVQWIDAYIELLHRQQEFVTAALIVKSAANEEINSIGQINADVSVSCGSCHKPLTLEKGVSSLKSGVWRCPKCARALGKCVYCHMPCLGRVTLSVGCGHFGHGDCLKKWFFDEGMNECPSGCGAVLFYR
ncbi:hypothetical protein CANCADRAFT_3248 [Tortispora caseinolytica NRRL Y-17796]|uniref:WDR59/RTC1-like RING zinc finger domain-containing protein n=1 Tax=Tortispora caseinolytica NRRL Y-17796 TaxID=767744 RepID=A0A1E4TA67_9ASCO|nr:hypothetical protein CANCADRAFT_3248 [Tortispora caseinolytica NRRL Y-17796]